MVLQKPCCLVPCLDTDVLAIVSLDFCTCLEEGRSWCVLAHSLSQLHSIKYQRMKSIIIISHIIFLYPVLFKEGEGEGEVAFFSAKRWDRRNRENLIESATPCHDARVVGLYRDSNPLRLTILAAMSEDYTTAPQHLQGGMPLSKYKLKLLICLVFKNDTLITHQLKRFNLLCCSFCQFLS